MHWKAFKISVSAFFLALVAVGLLSCGHEQQLTSIKIQPDQQTFGSSSTPVGDNAGSSVQLRALGSFIHPPVTKDITTDVTWASNTPDMVTVDPSGVLSATGIACGNALISATVSTGHSTGNIDSVGAIVTGNMTANVVCFTGTGPGVMVDFAGAGTGTVSSSPPGLGCSATCTANFAPGSTITIIAAPGAGATFGGWAGCDSTAGASCAVALSNSPRTVTVTFN
jgi:hypothetical protein